MNYGDTHKAIIDRCRKGDRSAQFELYQLYSKAMYNVCFRMLNNTLDAEDLLQQSFVDVFTKLHYFRHESSIGAWIKRIVVNNCINYLKKKRLLTTSIDDALPYGIAERPEPEQPASPLDIGCVKKALRNMPEGYRVVFSLYAMEGYDHKEIASILGVTEATSKSQYSRARRKLKEMILSSTTQVGEF